MAQRIDRDRLGANTSDGTRSPNARSACRLAPPATARRPASRFSGASGRSRGEGSAGAHRPRRSTRTPSCIRWCAGNSSAACPRTERRAFLFTNVIDSKGRSYDMPVVVGALAASPRNLCASAWGSRSRTSAKPGCAAIADPDPAGRRQRAALPGGRHHRRRPARRRAALASLPVPVSTPGFDSAPYLTATLCVTRDPETGIQNMGTYRAALKATDRAGGAHGGARGERRRRLSALAEIPRAQASRCRSRSWSAARRS